MSLTLDLPKDLEHRLTAEATRLGLPVEQYALQLLGDVSQPARQPKSGAELVAFWHREGVIFSRPDIADSQARARRIRHQAKTKS